MVVKRCGNAVVVGQMGETALVDRPLLWSETADRRLWPKPRLLQAPKREREREREVRPVDQNPHPGTSLSYTHNPPVIAHTHTLQNGGIR